MTAAMERCHWCGTDPIYVAYHDHVWGRPEYDDRALFEKLCLDGQQAGLSWITILKRQHSYQQAYDHFDPAMIVNYDEIKIAELLQNSGIIRNRLKVESIIRNARGYLELQQQGQSFSDFIWGFVDGKPVQNRWQTHADVPIYTPAAEALSKALKKKGFNFVGPTIVYAFMQATGLVNDHLISCPAHAECAREAGCG